MTSEHSSFLLVMRLGFFLPSRFSIWNHEHHLDVLETSVVIVLFSHLSEGDVTKHLKHGRQRSLPETRFSFLSTLSEGSLIHIQSFELGRHYGLIILTSFTYLIISSLLRQRSVEYPFY